MPGSHAERAAAHRIDDQRLQRSRLGGPVDALLGGDDDLLDRKAVADVILTSAFPAKDVNLLVTFVQAEEGLTNTVCQCLLQDRVGFICEEELKALRHDLEASWST
mgnify:CR=1 FL=1